ncbi:hypothetical protein BGW38_010706 [Lunasporangiospora selenospora]|uniref:rRNA-processing protein FYV7 n=1 Tax=Lunasporangiospora selenospora TaxID=979761 RepID=A0A9P6G242_9FUNG|nr:hypothetical protein BGW38_010706 [Lunasporangiospora selenospora]
MVKVKDMGLPRDSLTRRQGGRGGPGPRRDRRNDGTKTDKRMGNDYNTQFKNRDQSEGGSDGRMKKKGFNPMARAHMGSEAYRGHAKKLKAKLIHNAKVKKDYAKALKQEADNTPEFYKKVIAHSGFAYPLCFQFSLTAWNLIFGEKTIDDQGNVVAYGTTEGGDEENTQEHSAGDSEDDQEESGEEMEEDESESAESDDEAQAPKKGKGKGKGNKDTTATAKAGKQKEEPFKRAHKPNPFKDAIEKREREKKAIQEARDRAQKERALAKKGRDAYYAKRLKTTQRVMQKTPKGQPLMSNQIKMMLGKIKGDIKENKTRAPSLQWTNKGRQSHRGAKKSSSN